MTGNVRMAVGIVAAALIMLVGCAKTTQEFDGTESRDPLMRKALAKEREGDKDAALVCLGKVLDKNPCLAQAHLRIALLYHEYKKDYVRAIYHYNRYLELRPDTEKREMIQGRLRDAEVSFGSTIFDRSDRVGEEYAALEAENASLQKALRQVRQHLATRMAASSSSAAHAPTSDSGNIEMSRLTGEEKGPLATDESAGSVYIVQPNDTLSIIAAKVYENPRQWQRIYEANRDILGDRPDRLKTGQALKIPE